MSYYVQNLFFFRISEVVLKTIGLFMGFSIMTIVEWFEMFFFLLVGIPVFLTGGKLNIFACCVRRVPNEDKAAGASAYSAFFT